MLFITALCGLFTLICAKEVPEILFIHAKKENSKRFVAVTTTRNLLIRDEKFSSRIIKKPSLYNICDGF
jgi:hypothetical protein